METIKKYKIPSNDPRLKRHIYHDERSKNFTFDTSGLTIIDVEHKRLCPIFNQGQIGSCTGNAGVGAINTEPFLQNTTVYTADENGALKLYKEAEIIDGGVGYPPEDAGSYGLSIAKALANSKMISGYQHTFTLNDALKALSVYPIITGINWYTGMYTPDPDGRVKISGVVEGGHEIEGYKVDTKNGRIWFHNSWGTSWGVNGDFYLTWADYNTLLSQSGDVTVLIPPTVTPPPPAPAPPVSWPYKHFSPTEQTGNGHTCSELKPELLSPLDKARDIAGIPFPITSGVRTLSENEAAGGAFNSAHLVGMAVDISCNDQNRWVIVEALKKSGFTRIEVAPTHTHCDVLIDSSHPSPWLGVAVKD